MWSYKLYVDLLPASFSFVSDVYICFHVFLCDPSRDGESVMLSCDFLRITALLMSTVCSLDYTGSVKWQHFLASHTDSIQKPAK